MEIFRLFGSIFIDDKEASKSLQKTDKEAEKVGKTLQETIKTAGKWGQEMGKSLTTVGTNITKKAGVPLAALTASMVGLAKTTADYGDKVAKASQEVGLSVVAYQELSYALGQNNLDAAEADRLFGRLNQRLGMARQGNEKYRKTLEGLGVSMEALDKGAVSTDEAFMQIIESLAAMDDSQKQAAIAGDMFGTMLSRKMMPMIRGGAEGIEELRKRAHDLGIVMDEEAARKSELFGDTMDDLSRVMGGFSRNIGPELQAPLINIAKWITDIVAGASKWIKENPKLVKQIIIFGGAIAGILAVLVTLGTTLVITGKIIGVLGTIFNILTSKPMLIIAAIGLLWLAWENDWGNIRTITEKVWEVIKPILESAWEILGRAWSWAVDIAGTAWKWLTETTWAEKIEAIKNLITGGWQWLINIGGNAWKWLTETTWAEKIEDIKGWLSSAWEWVLNLGGKAWDWIDTNLPWLADAIRFIANALSTAWTWTLEKAGDAWDWLDEKAPWLTNTLTTLKNLIVGGWQWAIETAKNGWDWIVNTTWSEKLEAIKGWLTSGWDWAIETAQDGWEWIKGSKLFNHLTELSKLITDSKAWKWATDTAIPFIADVGSAIIEVTVETAGELYDGLKQGFKTGDWSKFFDVTSELWQKGMVIVASLQLASMAGAQIMAAIGSLFGNPAGGLGIGGVPLAIGLLSVGIQLMEAQKEGSYSSFAKNVLVAGLTAAIGGAVFGPTGALVGFNLGINLKLGEVLEGVGDAIMGVAGTPKSHMGQLREYDEYVQKMRQDAGFGFLDRFLGRTPEGLLSFDDWKKGAEAIGEAFGDGLESSTDYVIEKTDNLAQEVADRLIGQSPPPEGPLADIDEGGANITEAWVEGLAEGVEENTPLLTRALDYIKEMLSGVWEKVPENIRLTIEDAIAKAEKALFELDDLQEQLQNAITGGDGADDQAEGFMSRLIAGLDEKLEKMELPIARFTEALSSAGLQLYEVGKALASGNWLDALLSILMETESFAKAMELIGAVMAPVVALFDNILRPIIEGLLKLWNGIIDALISISIFGWRPFAGLEKHKKEWGDDGGGSGGGDDKGRGGRQVSEITGPTRDLLTDLLAPLANFGQIVALIQDIRNILYERMPNYDAFGMEFAGAGAIGGDIVFESGAIVISSSGTSATELSRDMLDAIEREMARRVNFGIRGRGGR